MTLEIDNLVAWERNDGKIIMSVNDVKRGAKLLRAVTPELTQKESRRKYSDKLREADGWLEAARRDAKRGDYKSSYQAVLCACAALDLACQYDTDPRA